jgi:hypothetical protein
MRKEGSAFVVCVERFALLYMLDPSSLQRQEETSKLGNGNVSLYVTIWLRAYTEIDAKAVWVDCLTEAAWQHGLRDLPAMQ